MPALPALQGPANKSERKQNRDKFLQIEGVKAKIEAMAKKFGVSPNEILQVMEKETGGSFSAAQQHFGGGGARGLIQFLGDSKDGGGTESFKTIKGKKYEISDIAKMGELEQLDLVETFFEEGLENAGQDKFQPGELSLAIAAPAFIGKDDEWIANWAKKNPDTYARMMKNNPGWVGDDGEMNKSSITSFYTGNLPNESEFVNVKENNQENVDDPNVAEAGLTGLPNLRETVDYVGEKGKALLDKVGDSKVGKFLKKYTPGEEGNVFTDSEDGSIFSTGTTNANIVELEEVDFSNANPEEQAANALQIMNEFKETFPDGIAYQEHNFRGSNVLYDKAAERISDHDKASLEENILAGSKAFYERYGAKGTEAFMQDDDTNRAMYLKFMKDNGYLSYTDSNGNVVNIANQDLNTAEGVNTSRMILGHFGNYAGNNKFASLVTGEKSGLFKFDTNFKNMVQDMNFNGAAIAHNEVFQIENTAINNLKIKMNNNEILKDFTETENIDLLSPDLGINDAKTNFYAFTRRGDKGYIFKNALDNKISEYLGDNNIDTRTNPDQTVDDALNVINSKVNADPNTGQFTDADGNVIPGVTDLSGLSGDDLMTESQTIEAEIHRLKHQQTELRGDDLTNALAEQQKMLDDIKREYETRGVVSEEYTSILNGTDINAMETYAGNLSEEYNNAPDWRKKQIDEELNALEKRQDSLQTAVVDKEEEPSTGGEKVKNWWKEGGKEKVGKGLAALGAGALGLLAGGMGVKHMKKALEDIPVEEMPKLDSAWNAHMTKMRDMAQSGLTSEEKAAANADLSKAYNLGVRNVMRGAGGSRGAFLANAGVLNANRVEGLLKLSAADAAMQRENMKNYGAALQYQNTYKQKKGQIDSKMAYDEAARKSNLHGQIGNALIETALDGVNYAMNSVSKQPLMDAYAKLFEQQGIGSDIATEQNQLNRTKTTQ